MTDGGGGGRRHFDEGIIIDLAPGQQGAGFPDHRAGTNHATLPPAVEHWPARQHDGRDIDRRCCHQAGGCRLVAAGGQHHTVERIAIEHLDQTDIGKIAVQRRGGAFAGFLNRVDRKFKGNTARIANAGAGTFRQINMVAVAGRQVAAGLGNADDRFAGAQFFCSR